MESDAAYNPGKMATPNVRNSNRHWGLILDVEKEEKEMTIMMIIKYAE
jgi:hypothetical protein